MPIMIQLNDIANGGAVETAFFAIGDDLFQRSPPFAKGGVCQRAIPAMAPPFSKGGQGGFPRSSTETQEPACG